MSGALRRLRVALVALGLLTMLHQAMALPAAAAARTYITASATASPGSLTVEGRLTSGGRGVPDASISIQLDGREVASTVTGGSGRFKSTVDVPADASGRARVTVLFAGTDSLAVSRQDINVILVPSDEPTRTEPPPETEPPPATKEPTRTATPEPTRSSTAISLTLDPPSAYPGDVLALTGKLTSASRGVAGVSIHFSVAGRDQPDSLTTTNSKGAFSTYLEIPADLPAGKLEVEALFRGTATLKATSSTAQLEVKEIEPEPTDTPTETATATPTATPTVESPGPSTTAPETSASATPLAGADSTPATPPSSNWGWFIAVVLATGGLALLSVVALFLRRQGGAAVPGDDDSFQLLGPNPDDGPAPRRGA